MAYFAELDDNNIVVRVVAVSDNDAPDPAPNDQAGNDFLNSIGLTGRWIQTSFNGRIRKRFAGQDFTYDPINDVFINPKPFPSWHLDDEFEWQAPVPQPTEPAYWDETKQKWVLVE